METRISVLIADDDPSVRDALAALIRGDPSLDVVAIAESAQQAIELAQTHLPAVAILDVNMPGGGAAAARGVRSCSPMTRVIAFSAHGDERSVKEMLSS